VALPSVLALDLEKEINIDVQIRENNPDTNYEGDTAYNLDNSTDSNSWSVVLYTDINTTAWSSIENANLSFSVFFNFAFGSVDICVYELIENFDNDTVTWNNKSSTQTWVTAGGTFDTQDGSCINIDGTENFWFFNITNLANRLLINEELGYLNLLVVVVSDEQLNEHTILDSFEQVGDYPKIVFSYSPEPNYSLTLTSDYYEIYTSQTLTLTSYHQNNSIGLSNTLITFQRSSDGITWENILNQTTDSLGYSVINYAQDESGTWYFRSHFPGDGTYSALNSSSLEILFNQMPSKFCIRHPEHRKCQTENSFGPPFYINPINLSWIGVSILSLIIGLMIFGRSDKQKHYVKRPIR
jgi:hypothetical protein